MNKEDKLLAKKIIENDPGVKEVIIRTGEAVKIDNSQPLSIVGNIDAVSRFIDYRKSEFDKLQSHCLVSKSQGTLEFTANEQWPLSKISVIGKIEISKVYTSLGVNDNTKSYSPNELSNKFKLLRSIFPDRGDHMKIVAALKNLKAKVNQEINKNDDTKGNVKVDFVQTVSSNVPEGFKINIPLIEGEESKIIEVDVVLEATSSHDINCFLESIDAAEMIDQEREKRVMEEVEKIKKETTIIFV